MLVRCLVINSTHIFGRRFRVVFCINLWIMDVDYGLLTKCRCYIINLESWRITRLLQLPITLCLDCILLNDFLLYE